MLSVGGKACLVKDLCCLSAPNFLMLDEPTNHLDRTTKKMVADFEGTMLFVSHDRHFLAALSMRLPELAPEGVRQ